MLEITEQEVIEFNNANKEDWVCMELDIDEDILKSLNQEVEEYNSIHPNTKIDIEFLVNKIVKMEIEKFKKYEKEVLCEESNA